MKAISYDVVKEAILTSKAQKLVHEDSSYYIIKFFSLGTGRVFQCDSGENKGKFIRVIGNTPDSTCSMEILCGEDNKFLVKTKKIEEKMIDYQLYKTELDLYCESYEFITPIHREYSCSTHSRLFYPKNYFDEYDVLYKDYRK